MSNFSLNTYTLWYHDEKVKHIFEIKENIRRLWLLQQLDTTTIENQLNNTYTLKYCQKKVRSGKPRRISINFSCCTYILNKKDNTAGNLDRWQWTASNEWGTNPFQQQFLVQIHRHHINGLRAPLTSYIINRRGMAMDSLKQIRDKSIPTTIPCHLVNGLELHLHPKISTEDRWQWTALNQ